jgi:group II intron reverse transcriptase/maturase
MGKKLKHHSVIDKVYRRLNLHISYEKVKTHKGAGGIDGVSIEEFEKKLGENIEEIHRLLYEDKYTPSPVRRVYIPKPNGDRRPLGIPTIRDRVVQQALLNRMEKIFESKFKDCSYGFRPGRSTLEAISKVEEYLKAGNCWVVEIDIEKFFDTVNHELLIDFVNEEIADGRVLRLIRAFLKAGVMEEAQILKQERGTPQGGVISPILANIYLHMYDEMMMQGGYKIVRYADDVVILCQSREEAEEALRRTEDILEGKLGLKLNKEKTKVVHKKQSFEFLGYAFGSGYSDYKIPRKRAVDKFKEKIRKLTRRKQPKTMSQIVGELNPVIRGWRNYFKHGSSKKIFWELDCWIENRLRAFKVKRWGLKTHLKMPHWKFEAMGLETLNETFYSQQLKLLPGRGQRYREAVCGKTARTV